MDVQFTVSAPMQSLSYLDVQRVSGGEGSEADATSARDARCAQDLRGSKDLGCFRLQLGSRGAPNSVATARRRSNSTFRRNFMVCWTGLHDRMLLLVVPVVLVFCSRASFWTLEVDSQVHRIDILCTTESHNEP